MAKSFNYKKLLQYFLQGLLILGPVTITAYFLYWAVSSIDSLIPIFSYTDAQGVVHVRNYGIGFVIIIAFLIIIGYVSSFFITSRFVSFFEKLPVSSIFMLPPVIFLKHLPARTKNLPKMYLPMLMIMMYGVLVLLPGKIWRILD